MGFLSPDRYTWGDLFVQGNKGSVEDSTDENVDERTRPSRSDALRRHFCSCSSALCGFTSGRNPSAETEFVEQRYFRADPSNRNSAPNEVIRRCCRNYVFSIRCELVHRLVAQMCQSVGPCI